MFCPEEPHGLQRASSHCRQGFCLSFRYAGGVSLASVIPLGLSSSAYQMVHIRKMQDFGRRSGRCFFVLKKRCFLSYPCDFCVSCHKRSIRMKGGGSYGRFAWQVHQPPNCWPLSRFSFRVSASLSFAPKQRLASGKESLYIMAGMLASLAPSSAHWSCSGCAHGMFQFLFQGGLFHEQKSSAPNLFPARIAPPYGNPVGYPACRHDFVLLLSLLGADALADY